jgi:hypothetical protein
MRDLPDAWKDSIELQRMIIPGAHDAGSYKTNNKSALWRCQSSPLSEMIKNGVRFFDVSINWVKNTWMMVRGQCYFDINIYDWLEEGFKDLSGNEEEILIFSIRMQGKFDGPVEYNKITLIDFLAEKYVEHLVRLEGLNEEELAQMTYRKLRENTLDKRKPTVIFFLSRDLLVKKSLGFFRGGCVDDHDRDCTNASDMVALDQYLHKKSMNFSYRRQPACLDIMQGFLHQESESHEELEDAHRVKEHVCSFIKSEFMKVLIGTRFLNIVIFNFIPGGYNVIPTFVELNASLANRTPVDPGQFKTCRDCPDCSWHSKSASYKFQTEPTGYCKNSLCNCSLRRGTCVSVLSDKREENDVVPENDESLGKAIGKGALAILGGTFVI